MKKIVFALIITISLSGLVGCGGPSVIVGELSPYGQMNPFIPAVKGGCLVGTEDITDLYVKYEDGVCTVKTAPTDKEPLEQPRNL